MCWKSRSRGGRPAVPKEVRKFIREMGSANWLRGAPRIHGELLKLDIEVTQSKDAKHMVKRPRRPGQCWATSPRNHAEGIAAAACLSCLRWSRLVGQVGSGFKVYSGC